jgi:hypothetical protein
MKAGYNVDYYLQCGARDADMEGLWRDAKTVNMLRITCPQKPDTVSERLWSSWTGRCRLDWVMLRGYR